jgi:acetolactate synthase, large subunit (EC 2.2.1.6)
MVTDVGQHQIWAGRYYPIEQPRTFITSGGLGTMGYGLPAAIGAKLGRPEKQVLLVTGDGSFQMNLAELATMVQENAAVKILLFNNRSLGMVRELQQHLLGERYYQSRMEVNPDFIKLAAAYGIEAFQVRKEMRLPREFKDSWNLKDQLLRNCHRSDGQCYSSYQGG